MIAATDKPLRISFLASDVMKVIVAFLLLRMFLMRTTLLQTGD